MSSEHSSRVQSNRRFGPGDHVGRRWLTTIGSEQIEIPDRDSFTHLQFRRFASCPLCNLHLQSIAARHDEIHAAGITEVVVFPSTVDAMITHQGGLPFAAISDTARSLYAEFAVESSPRSVLDPRAWTAPLQPRAWRVVARELRDPGSRPFSLRGGDMFGLPADFLIGPDGGIREAKYGAHADDQWSVDDLLELARRHVGGS